MLIKETKFLSNFDFNGVKMNFIFTFCIFVDNLVSDNSLL
jgi:hypothetical protein